MAISSAGLGSGIPINDLVSQLVAAEAAPTRNRLDRSEAQLQTELSAVGLLKGALSDFQSKLSGLADQDSFINRKASTTDSKVASISAEQTAALGSYSLEVLNLASAHNLVAQNGYADASEGTLTFQNQAGDSFEVSIDAEDAALGLAGVAAAINEEENNFGINAKIINVNGVGRLILSADETGADNRITSVVAVGTGDIQNFGYDYSASVDGDDANWDQSIGALDANFRLEGQLMSAASNTLEDVIPNATITLKSETEIDTPISLTISTNTSNVKSMIEAFVAGYNEFNNIVSQLTAYNSETGQSAALQGDALTRSIQGQIRSLVGGNGTAFGSINALANLGITTERDGSMKVDAGKLSAALDNSFSDVAGFFSDPSTGMASRLDSTMGGYLKSSGSFASRTDMINDRLERIDAQREALALRLEKLETRYLRQFNAMDALVANLSSTGNFLTQQLDSIAKIQQSQYSK